VYRNSLPGIYCKYGACRAMQGREYAKEDLNGGVHIKPSTRNVCWMKNYNRQDNMGWNNFKYDLFVFLNVGMKNNMEKYPSWKIEGLTKVILFLDMLKFPPKIFSKKK
jgi:hypothetical protein